jgi:hypothetical protein
VCDAIDEQRWVLSLFGVGLHNATKSKGAFYLCSARVDVIAKGLVVAASRGVDVGG